MVQTERKKNFHKTSLRDALLVNKKRVEMQIAVTFFDMLFRRGSSRRHKTWLCRAEKKPLVICPLEYFSVESMYVSQILHEQ